MIKNDTELKVTQERIAQFQSWVSQFRQTARLEEFDALSSSYLYELEKMHAQVMEYLARPLTPSASPADSTTTRDTIANDTELRVTQERITEFQKHILHLRLKARPEEFESVTGFWRWEIETMHAEVMEYLMRPLETTDSPAATPSVTPS